MNGSILPRLAAGLLRQALQTSPVVVLTGSRQTGKSTLARHLPDLAERPYWTLDDIEVRGQARSQPDDLVRRTPVMTLDEVQREPDLILALKRAVDAERPRRPGRFLLTGSANLLVMPRVSETLAGRATYVTLWPLTRRERLGLGAAGIWSELVTSKVDEWYDIVKATTRHRQDWKEIVRLGGYPTPAHELHTDDQRRLWFAGYIQTYLERDLQDLAAIDSLADFQRLMRAAALRNGTLLNQAEIGRDIGIPRPTVHRYFNLLETSYQIIRLEPFSVNRTKRLVKTPKLYWTDTGLALFLAGTAEPAGAHLENLVVCDLLAWRDSQVTKPSILYWRTSADQEVDFVIEAGRHLIGIEVKASPKPATNDVRHLRAFMDEYGKTVHGCLLLHTGDEISWISKGILAVPWWRIL